MYYPQGLTFPICALAATVCLSKDCFEDLMHALGHMLISFFHGCSSHLPQPSGFNSLRAMDKFEHIF